MTVASHHARFDQSSGQLIQTGSFITRFHDVGDPEADVIVLLHDGAWGGSSDVSWSRCVPSLARQYRVIAPDFLGFGGSDKATFFDRSPYQPRIHQLMQLLDILKVTGPLHVVGTSFGGSVALRLLDEAAIPLRSVTSIGGSGGPWKTAIMKEQLGSWDGTRADLARVLHFLMDDGNYFDSQLNARNAAAQHPGHYRAVASAAMPLPDVLRHSEPDPWPEPLSGTTVPALLLAGEQDELFERDWPDHIAEAVPHATIQRMDTRHSPNLDRPNEVTEILLEYLQQVERQ